MNFLGFEKFRLIFLPLRSDNWLPNLSADLPAAALSLDVSILIINWSCFSRIAEAGSFSSRLLISVGYGLSGALDRYLKYIGAANGPELKYFKLRDYSTSEVMLLCLCVDIKFVLKCLGLFGDYLAFNAFLISSASKVRA